MDLFADDLGTNASRLAAQMAFIYDVCRQHESFNSAVPLLRKIHVCHVPFSMPMDKHEQIFEQHSPLGSSRVVADALSIDEHVARATRVSVSPRKNPAEFVDADLLECIGIVASFSSCPADLVRRRQIVGRIAGEIAASLAPLNDHLRTLAPWCWL